jgi:hypothetical protein
MKSVGEHDVDLNEKINIYLLFWYHVLTCVSLRFNLLASSIRSWTLRYFWRSNDFSRVWSWWSVNAVRAFRCFLLSPDDPFLNPSSSFPPIER